MRNLRSVLLCAIVAMSVFLMGSTTAKAASDGMIGDIDCDGAITDWDGVLLTRYLAGWTIDNPEESIMDIDGDGEVSEWDRILLDRYLAGWSVEAQIGQKAVYTITYENTKGAVFEAPTTYQSGGFAISLPQLSAPHHTFVGWEMNGKRVYEIPADSEGDLVLTALWSPKTYQISYTNTKGAENPNPAEYTIESDTISLESLSCEGYQFAGWYWDGIEVASIPTGTAGDITIEARWTPLVYSITYQNTKGVSGSNPTLYTIEDTVILQDISAEGYVFEGWYANGERVTCIEAGSTGEITLSASWALRTYTITYENTKGAENPNIGTYTIETEAFTLENLSASGYAFAGWTMDGNAVTQLGGGMTGDLVVTANWTPMTYTITYRSPQYPTSYTFTNNNPTQYTMGNRLTLTDPTIDSYHTFQGWYTDTMFTKKITAVEAGTTGNLTLYAKWAFNGTYIRSASDFASIVYDPGGAYELTCNITITSTICDSYNPFTGYFNGGYYQISGAQPFGTIKGTVTHLRTANALATDNKGRIEYCVAGNGLVATNSGTIFQSGSTGGYVVSGSYSAGLVGSNSGTISQCFSKGSVEGKQAGGLVGYNSGTIVNSYSIANVSATTTLARAGGLVCVSGGGSIKNCYAAGAVYATGKDVTTGYITMGDAYAAGLVCEIYGTSVSDCFYGGSKVYARATGDTISSYITCSTNNCTNTYYPSESGTGSWGTSPANFKAPSFITSRLGWSSSIWILRNGYLPELEIGYLWG